MDCDSVAKITFIDPVVRQVDSAESSKSRRAVSVDDSSTVRSSTRGSDSISDEDSISEYPRRESSKPRLRREHHRVKSAPGRTLGGKFYNTFNNLLIRESEAVYVT